MDNVTPSHWKYMAEETRLGWPMLRERLTQMAQRILSGLDNPALHQAFSDDGVFEDVSWIIRERASSVLRV